MKQVLLQLLLHQKQFNYGKAIRLDIFNTLYYREQEIKNYILLANE